MAILIQSGAQRLRVLKEIGSGVHVQAEIPDTSRIFVSIGLGFYPEVTLEEACGICSEKEKFLRQQIEKEQLKVADIEANITLISDGLMGLRQLSGL